MQNLQLYVPPHEVFLQRDHMYRDKYDFVSKRSYIASHFV